eukprot:TRINITY_DN545_c0_g1_i1.p1 TRINITY_DN545_c0_g1~~TRINITY_DN545_c0_g1_i1.p1  ORF type:complete len:536 (-),score=85.54 TRINITY_DN545_c0_g1_i1:62-1669(-)
MVSKEENDVAYSLFAKGFLKYSKNGKFSDVILRCEDGNTYPAHRLILAYSSEFFSRLLLSDFKESTQSLIDLKYPDPENVFPLVLSFMYEGRIVITLENVIPLLAMADHYLIKDLRDLCSQFLTHNITRDNALAILRSAMGFHFENIIDKCITVIAKNFPHISDSDYQFMPPTLFLQLLYNPFLVVKNEFALYKLVCSYIEAHQDLDSKQVNDMTGAVRFVFMTFEQLVEVEENPLVPRAYLIEAFMERLKRFELRGQEKDLHERRKRNTSVVQEQHTYYQYLQEHGAMRDTRYINNQTSITLNNNNNNNNNTTNIISSSNIFGRTPSPTRSSQSSSSSSPLNSGGLNLRLMARPPQSIIFEYTFDFDNKGILYWIATNCYREPWTNPHIAGRAKVTASSIEKGLPSELLALQPTELWSKDVPASWFTIDLGPDRAVIPTCYTLRHGMSFKADSLRTWDLQGSLNGEQWVLIKRHANDQVLNGKFSTHTWPISNGDPVGQSFRYFRILQTGRNSNSRNFLVLSGFEVYGELFERY